MWIWLLLKSISTNSSFLISIYIDFTIGEFYFICVMKMYLINVASQFYKSYSLSWFLISQESIDYTAQFDISVKNDKFMAMSDTTTMRNKVFFCHFYQVLNKVSIQSVARRLILISHSIQQWLQNMILQRYRVKVHRAISKRFFHGSNLTSK